MPRGPSSMKLKFGFHQRGQPGDEMKLHPLDQLRGFKADGAKDNVHPLVAA